MGGIASMNYNSIIQHNGIKISAVFFHNYVNSPAGVEIDAELHQTYASGVAVALPCWEYIAPEEFQISFCGITGSKAKFKVRGTKSPQICVIAVGI